MYYEHFGFQLPPFSISPDPHFLYLSERHRDALAHLIYGAGENGGFVLLTGQVGTGKTTLIRSLVSQALPDVDIALCLHSGLSVIDFVATLLDELQISYPDNPTSLKPLVDALNAYLLQQHAEGRQTVLIIDEGQNLSREVLEQVRLLTNLETDNQKLLRIILVGQEELQDIINRSDLRQLSQRITGRYHLTALNKEEVSEYITHRIKTAKGNPSCFTHAAIKHVYRHSGGVPRLINVLCDRALLVAYNADTYRVSAKHIDIAASETMPQTIAKHQSKTANPLLAWSLLPVGVLTLLSFAYGAYRYLNDLSGMDSMAAVSSSQTAGYLPSPLLANAKSVSRETSMSAIHPQEENQNKRTQHQRNASVVASLPRTGKKTINDDVSALKNSSIISSSHVPEKILETVSVSTVAKYKPSEIESADSPKPPSSNSISKTYGLVNSNAESIVARQNLPSDVSTRNSQDIPTMSLIQNGISQTEGIRLLLKRWSLTNDISANQTACQLVESQAMQCLFVRGGLPLVREINRPVLLELTDETDTTWLPVIGFDSKNTVICLKDNIPQACDAGEIATYWSGNFLVLLRQPNVSVTINPGFEGEQIQWLRQRIAIAEKRRLSSVSASLHFDEQLVQKVKTFQKSRGIAVDGVIGNKTLLYLHNVVIDETTPILSSEGL